MSWTAMTDVPNPIIVDAAGTAGSGYVLKAYLPGTTTTTSIAIDSSGSSPQSTITANSEGKWEVSGNEVVPFIDRTHKWGIFASAAHATANTPFYMGPFDNVPQTGSATDSIYTPAGTGAVATTVQAELRKTHRTSNFTTLAAAITAAANGRLVVDSEVTITSAHTFPTTLEVEVTNAGLIIDGGGGTLQINGGFICSPKNQAFSGFANGEVIFDTAGYSNAVERVGYPEWWGVTGTNDEVPINKCILACRNTILTGQYVQSAKVAVPYDTAISRAVIGLNRQATLLSAVNNITQLHWSGTYGFCKGITITGNGQTGTIGLKIATTADVDDKTNATWQATVENQNNNVFEDLRFKSMDSGIVLACGPNVAGLDSGLYHNKILRPEFTDCTTRAILFRDMTSGSNPAVGSGSNSNYFERPTFLGTIATGIDIQSGGGNVFLVPHFENITKSINIANTMTNTGANPRNCFIYAHEENVTNPSTISNTTTVLLMHDLNVTGTVLTELPIDISSGQNGQFFMGGIRSLAETEMLKLDNSGNLMFQGITTPATNATNTLHMPIGVASSSNITNGAQMLVKDIRGAADKAGFHIKNEPGREGVVSIIVPKDNAGDINAGESHEMMWAANYNDRTLKVYLGGAWVTIASGW